MSEFNWDSIPDAKPSGKFNWDDHPDAPQEPSLKNKILDTHVPGGTIRGYTKGLLNQLPTIGMIGGGIAGTPADLIAGPMGTVAGAGLGAAGGKALQNLGEKYILDEDKSRSDIYADPVKEGMMGAAGEAGAQSAGKALQMAAQTKPGQAVAGLLSKVGNKIGGAAESLAENATGATGAQASKFKDGAGRELLDRKLVRFGDNAKNVADRVSGAVDGANSNIDSALKQLDAKGTTASADNVVSDLQKQIQEMKQDPSKAGASKKLQSIIEDIVETGNSKVPLSLGEETKRGFRKAAGNWMDPDAGQAGKSAYLAYRDEVEKAAKAADPALANLFKEGKETYGLLSPIQEAADKRASTLKQSPFGGLLDVAAAGGTGAAIGGAPGLATGVGAAIGRRVIAPRIASSAAVTLDSIAKGLLSSPKYADMAKNNPAMFQAVVYKLGSKMNPTIESAENALPRAADNKKSKNRTSETTEQSQ